MFTRHQKGQPADKKSYGNKSQSFSGRRGEGMSGHKLSCPDDPLPDPVSATTSLSLHFNGHFPGEPGSAGAY